MRIMNPANGEVIRELPEDTAASIAEKARRAREAQLSWANTPLEARLEAMRRFRAALERDKEELSRILTSEVGKPITQSRNELNGTLTRLDFFLEKTPVALREEQVFRDASQKLEETITREPLGVIASISAWNYPYFVGSNVFIPALLTGNAVLYKPSEHATLTGLAIAERLHRSGVPKEIFTPLVGAGEVGAELLRQELQGVYFTGSYATGSRIAQAVTPRLIRMQLELGGKDPSYICDDAPIRNAAESTADGAFYNNGQSCCSVERIYVHERIHDEFVERFLATVRGFAVGDPLDEKTYIGPLTRAAQLEIVERQIRDAVAKGARRLCGGQRLTSRPGNYFEPTVLVDVTHEMEVMREESFGPVIGIQKVSGDEEAIRLMNDTEYGLTAGVYTPDRERARRILSRVQAGSAYWNCCDRVSPRLPWSGRRHSGIGSTLSIEGILAFTQPKAWHLRSP